MKCLYVGECLIKSGAYVRLKKKKRWISLLGTEFVWLMQGTKFGRLILDNDCWINRTNLSSSQSLVFPIVPSRQKDLFLSARNLIPYTTGQSSWGINKSKSLIRFTTLALWNHQSFENLQIDRASYASNNGLLFKR